MKEFKVGDKVTCLLHGKGKVINVDDVEDFPVEVQFDDDIVGTYSLKGSVFSDTKGSKHLYHGHGTFNIEFVEDKEPEYEWQWFYEIDDGEFGITQHETEESLQNNYVVDSTFKRIEESKREVKK